MDISDRSEHRIKAGRLRSAAAMATTAAIRARLLEEAAKHDRLARGLPADEIKDQRGV